jgi:hypothetical protein
LQYCGPFKVVHLLYNKSTWLRKRRENARLWEL